FILPSNSRRTAGRDAQRLNIAAAKLVGETVRTTLGPKGMDKMLVNSLGDVIVTNDGVTILREMNVEHPAAKMIVEIAKTQESEVGDGTTTAVVIAAELLRKAEDLLDADVHPTVIARGYRIATEKAQTILASLSQKAGVENTDILKKLANTAMTGKGAEMAREHLSDIVVEAIVGLHASSGRAERDQIRIKKRTGGSVEDTELIDGMLIEKEKVHPQMPTRLEKARIAVLGCAIEIKETEMDAKISINDPAKLQAFLDMEEGILRNHVEKIKAAGANVVICQKGIDDTAQHFLARAGIYACRRVRREDLQDLARATGASIISDINELRAQDVGSAGLVEEVRVSEDEHVTYIRGCKQAKTVTILVRGGSEHIISEVARALEDAIGDVITAIHHQRVVAGAGSVEIELSRQLLDFANTLSGREQLAVRAFAEALEVIPRTLAENAGLDAIDTLADLKAAHNRGETLCGINVFTGKVMNAWKEGVVEPLRIKTQALSSASDVAQMILRIDDVIINESARPDQMSEHEH
ncbi:MAG: thermosome subunit alpha, partial [Nanoarchaeota archaeon]